MKLVLDTNVVLDWLVFADPALKPFTAALASHSLTLVTHTATLSEFARVLTYPQFKLDAARQAALSQRYLECSQQFVLPEPFTAPHWQLPAGFPQCRDVDDQVFLALAFHSQAMLVSKDRQVLKLRRRVRQFGLVVLTVPELMSQLASSAPYE